MDSLGIFNNQIFNNSIFNTDQITSSITQTTGSNEQIFYPRRTVKRPFHQSFNVHLSIYEEASLKFSAKLTVKEKTRFVLKPKLSVIDNIKQTFRIKIQIQNLIWSVIRPSLQITNAIQLKFKPKATILDDTLLLITSANSENEIQLALNLLLMKTTSFEAKN